MKNITKMSPPSCYCGQSGDSNLNMLECVKCRRWFHEECTKCLDLPMLLGDRFYIFICSVCNAGSECLGRLELKWSEITQLLLYNLSTVEKKKYFHLDDTIVPFLLQNWERFHIFGPAASEKKSLREKVVNILKSCSSRFKCGKEVKKCKSIWALRERVPPKPPDVLPTGARLEKDVVVWDFQVKDRAYHIITVKKSTKNKENLKNGKAKSKPTQTSSTRQKSGEVSKCRESLPQNENGVHKSKHKNKRTTILFDEDSARLGLLDSLIPLPSNFSICNNPFKSLSEENHTVSSHSQSDKALMKTTKRRKNTENSYDLTVINGIHQNSDEYASNESASFMTTKDSHSKRSKEVDFSILGKRTSSTGKVQYLFQRNRFTEPGVSSAVETLL